MGTNMCRPALNWSPDGFQDNCSWTVLGGQKGTEYENNVLCLIVCRDCWSGLKGGGNFPLFLWLQGEL